MEEKKKLQEICITKKWRCFFFGKKKANTETRLNETKQEMRVERKVKEKKKISSLQGDTPKHDPGDKQDGVLLGEGVRLHCSPKELADRVQSWKATV